MTSVSAFWRSVPGHPQSLEPAVIAAPSLAEAARLAMRRHDAAVAFRRNRELIDLHGRFRRFLFGGQAFVAKRAASSQELTNARQVHRLLAGVPGIRAIVPEEAGEGILVAPDLGATLHEQPEALASLVAAGSIGALAGTLIGCGIVWEGLAPRNLVHAGGVFLLLDLEDVAFGTTCTDLTRFKWRLNWEPHGALPQIEAACEPLRTTVAPLDSFERAYAALTGAEDVRGICARATLISERSLALPHEAPWTPFEAGHFADDLLPPSLSVLYTFATAAGRQERGEAWYADRLRRLHDAASAAVVAGPAEVALALLSVCAGIEEPLATLRSLGKRRGLPAALRRAELLDVVVAGLANWILEALGRRGAWQLLLRGSLGQAVVGCRSDVDFEISSPAFPLGVPAVEEALRDALALAGIESEGSAGRPREADLVAGCLTRDLHEWMELRQPGSPAHAPGWNAGVFTPPRHWFTPSTFERAGLPRTPKALFFRVRTLIARLAFSHGLQLAATRPQLVALVPLVGEEAAHRLEALLEEALTAYEEEREGEELLVLEHTLEALAASPGGPPEIGGR
jgi:hypothetical protein